MTSDTEPTPHQYLAWGGESEEEGFRIITVREIRKAYESDHYSGNQTWSGFALLALTLNGDADLAPVTILAAGEREVDDEDYIHQSYKVVAGGAVVDSFYTRIDGRS